MNEPNRFIDTSASSSGVDFRAMPFQIGATTHPSHTVSCIHLSLKQLKLLNDNATIAAVDFAGNRIFHSQVIRLKSKGKRRKAIPLFNLFLIHPLANGCLLPRVHKVDKVFTDGTTHILGDTVSFVRKKTRKSSSKLHSSN